MSYRAASAFSREMENYLAPMSRVETAEFEIVGIEGNRGLRRQRSISTFVMTWWARGRTADASSAWDIG